MKHVSEMSEAEKAAAFAELLKQPKPEPMPTDKMARDMTPAEQDAWLRELNRRFG
jgi:hypothetical protein